MQFMHPNMKFWNVTFAHVQTPVSKYSSQHIFHVLTWWVALIDADFVGWDWFCCSCVWSSLFWIWKQCHTKDSENLADCVFCSAVRDSTTSVLQSHSQVHCNEMTLGNSVPSSACCWKSWMCLWFCCLVLHLTIWRGAWHKLDLHHLQVANCQRDAAAVHWCSWRCQSCNMIDYMTFLTCLRINKTLTNAIFVMFQRSCPCPFCEPCWAVISCLPMKNISIALLRHSVWCTCLSTQSLFQSVFSRHSVGVWLLSCAHTNTYSKWTATMYFKLCASQLWMTSKKLCRRCIAILTWIGQSLQLCSHDHMAAEWSSPSNMMQISQANICCR